MSEYATPHVNRLEGVLGVFRVWTDNRDQKTSRLVTRDELSKFFLAIERELTADATKREDDALGRAMR
jgi:hypothetical protein